jgi:hypothetical protein
MQLIELVKPFLPIAQVLACVYVAAAVMALIGFIVVFVICISSFVANHKRFK